MSHRVCPWWVGYLLACPLRRFAHDPVAILSPHVSAGMTVLEPGPGMGFFTLDLARLVGEAGRVVAVDVEPRMLRRLARRAQRAGLDGRIELRRAQPGRLGIEDLRGAVDFALAFAVVHELPEPAAFMREVHDALKPGATLLIAEPVGHVGAEAFAATCATAAAAGFRTRATPPIRRSRAVLLERPA